MKRILWGFVCLYSLSLAAASQVALQPDPILACARDAKGEAAALARVTSVLLTTLVDGDVRTETLLVPRDRLWEISADTVMGQVSSTDLEAGQSQMRWIPGDGSGAKTTRHPATHDEIAGLERLTIELVLRLHPLQVKAASVRRGVLRGSRMNIVTIPGRTQTQRHDLYLDAKDCRLRRMVTFQTRADGITERAAWIKDFDDYRAVEGVSLPHTVKVKADPEWWVRMIVQRRKYSLNVDYDPSIFSDELRPVFGGWRRPQADVR